jgi:hypothetical protein
MAALVNLDAISETVIFSDRDAFSSAFTAGLGANCPGFGLALPTAKALVERLGEPSGWKVR